jgi:FAD:protein FMN transferase
MRPSKVRSRSTTSRREILRARSLRPSLQNRSPAFDMAASGGYYLRIGRRAMACQFEVFLRPKDRSFVAAVHEALDEVDRLEAQMTVYREDSELSRLNRSAFLSPVGVEERLYLLLRFASTIGKETGGAFDITAGPLIRCWGFFERKGRRPGDEELRAAREVTGWDKVTFDDAACSVSFCRQGVELNLGSIGKGYALDRAAERLRKAGLRDFLIHAGHSSVLAFGDSNRGPGWEISVRDARVPQGELGSFCLVDQGMSTSGVGEQFFTANGRRFGHILDPRTGWPSGVNLLCSVVAPTAARAEALSTAFFVMDAEEVQSYCEAHPRVGTIVLPASPTEEGEKSNSRPAPFCWGVSLRQTGVWS